MGASALSAPFKGGTLVPAPTVVLAGLPLDAQGALSLSGSWPDLGAGGFPFWLRLWFADPGGPLGWAATSGVRATVP